MSKLANFQTDYARGIKAEKVVLPLLEPYLGNLIRIPEATHNFDFEGNNIYVELKDRSVAKDSFPTTLIPYCKIEAAKRLQPTPCWFVFRFIDGIYVIQFNEKLFSQFEVVPDWAPHRRAYEKKTPTPHMLIPIKYLRPLDSLPTLETAAYPLGLPVV